MQEQHARAQGILHVEKERRTEASHGSQVMGEPLRVVVVVEEIGG